MLPINIFLLCTKILFNNNNKYKLFIEHFLVKTMHQFDSLP